MRSSPPPIEEIDPVSELRRFLGATVFIDWPKGVKGIPKKWKHLQLSDMTPRYIAKLSEGNIGVALGEVSGGLYVIDIDLDPLVEPFLALNPRLADTFRTRGNRGAAFWLRAAKGSLPKFYTLRSSLTDKDVGEVRPNGHQSIVWGTHPDTGNRYQWLVKKPVVEIEFVEIRWPDSVIPTSSLDESLGTLLGASLGSASRNDPRNNPKDYPLYDNTRVRVCENASSSSSLESDVDSAVSRGIAGGGGNHKDIIPRVASRFLSLRGLKNGTLMSFAEKAFLGERVFVEMKSRGLTTKPKVHVVSDMINTLNNPKVSASDPVPFALARARSDETPDELRSVEMLFEDENGRDENFMLYLRWCYFMHVETSFGEWGITQRKVAREIFGAEEPHYKTVGAWQELLAGYRIIELIAKHVQKQKSRRYRWIWKGEQTNEKET